MRIGCLTVRFTILLHLRSRSITAGLSRSTKRRWRKLTPSPTSPQNLAIFGCTRRLGSARPASPKRAAGSSPQIRRCPGHLLHGQRSWARLSGCNRRQNDGGLFRPVFESQGARKSTVDLIGQALFSGLHVAVAKSSPHCSARESGLR